MTVKEIFDALDGSTICMDSKYQVVTLKCGSIINKKYNEVLRFTNNGDGKIYIYDSYYQFVHDEEYYEKILKSRVISIRYININCFGLLTGFDAVVEF